MAMELLTGVTLQQGKYRIVRTLGRGGFGITYLAEQVLAKRMVCIKEFFPKDYYKRDGDSQHISLSSDGFRETMGRFKDKFLKEAQLIAGLDHPNIIRIHDLFEENGTAYYVMEYIDGESLHSLVSRRGALSEADAKGYIEQLAAALSHIHAHDIAHLDVKPGNIMVQAKDNRAVLIDFGLSKHYDVGGAQTSSTPVGISHGYAPMEQYQTGGVSTFSPGTDIYSMGATLYFLTVGKTPPTAAIVGEDGLGVLPSHLSESTRTAIERAMQLRRKDRPASVEEFLSLLHGASEDTFIELQPESELRATPSKPADNQPEPQPKRQPERQPKRKGWWLWLLLLLAVVGVVCGVVLSGGEDKEENVVVTTEAEEVVVDSLDTSETEINATSEHVSESVKAEKPAEPAIKLTSKPKASVSADSGSGKISYAITNPSDGVKPKVKSSADWLVVTMSGNTISYTTTANPSDKSRSAKITIIYGDESIEIVITQAGKPKPNLELTSPSSASVTADGGGGKVEYTLTNRRDDLKLLVNSSADWLIVNVSGDTITYTTKANLNESSRSAKITVKYGDQSFEIVITQAGKPKPVVPEAKTYNIGDYYNENGKQGVVFDVWDGGRHGKIVSLDETNGVWDSRVKYDGGYKNGTRTYTDSKSDGKANTDKIMSRSDRDYFPAFKWCRAKGSSWYLPAVDELEKIYNNKSVLNATLQKYGAALYDNFYWSSTEFVDYETEFCAWFVLMRNGLASGRNKLYDFYVRAVSAF